MSRVLIYLGLFLIVELYLFGWLVNEWGLLVTLTALVLMTLVGSRIAKYQGAMTGYVIANKLRHGEPIAQDAAEAVMLFVPMFLFIFPGFISDVLGVFLLFPIVRRWGGAILLYVFLEPDPIPHSWGGTGATIIEGDVILDVGTTPSHSTSLVLRNKKAKLPPKYRNPNNPQQTWSGRGRKPGWFLAHVDGGGRLEELEII